MKLGVVLLKTWKWCGESPEKKKSMQMYGLFTGTKLRCAFVT